MTIAYKKILLAQIQSRLEVELEALKSAAQAAEEAATHEESKPENEYDTRGLEASYLAGAQRERVTELEAALQRVKGMAVKDFSASTPIALTALVEVETVEGRAHFFILGIGAGYALQMNGQRVTVITPQSPLGKALTGKEVGDVVTVRIAGAPKENDERDYEVLAIT